MSGHRDSTPKTRLVLLDAYLNGVLPGWKGHLIGVLIGLLVCWGIVQVWP